MNWKGSKESQRKERPKFNFGIVRIAIVRSMFLVSFFQVCMVGYLFVVERGWSWWYVLAPAVFFAYAIFDRLVTYRQELSQNIINSEEFMSLINGVEDVNRKLDNLKVPSVVFVDRSHAKKISEEIEYDPLDLHCEVI